MPIPSNSPTPPATLMEAAAAANPLQNSIVGVQSNALNLANEVQLWDNSPRDGKWSAYEIMTGLINSPRFLFILVSLITSVYGLYKTIVGLTSQDWDTGGILFSISLVIAALVMGAMLKKTQDAQVSTIKQINDNHDAVLRAKVAQIQALEVKVEAIKEDKVRLEREVVAWRTNTTLYKFKSDMQHASHPDDKIPDIALLEG